MTHLFVSYSRQDKDFVDRLTHDIEDAGFEIWMDREDIRGGSQWRAAITQAIRDCEAFLVVLSPNSVGSRNVGRELELAAEYERPIMPIICSPCDIPTSILFHFAGVQRIDFSDRSSGNALDQLIDGLKHITGKEKPAKKPPREFRNSVRPASPASPSLQPAVAQPSPASLPQMLPGRWDVQVTHMMRPPIQVRVDLYPNGFFQGQMTKPMVMGVTAISGQWQVTPMNQILMQGQETDGYLVAPYGAVIQIHQVAGNQLTGMTSGGEQVVWNKMA